MSSSEADGRKLFIGGLSRDTTDQSLASFYQQWGDTQDVVVMKDPMTGRSRGFGFVTFITQQGLEDSMAARPHIIDGKTVDPKRAVPRDENGSNAQKTGEANVSSKRLYLANIREEHSEASIQHYFEKYGQVEKVEIILDKITNKPRGFGFITFTDYDPVDKCVLEKSHMIDGIRCDCKKALNKEEMARAQQNRERNDRFGRSRGMGRDAYGGPGRGGYQGGGGSYGNGGSYGGGYGGQQAGYGGGYGGGYGAGDYQQQGGYAGYGGAQAGYAGYGGGYGGQAAQGGWGAGQAAQAWGSAQGANAAAAGAWGQGGGQQPAQGGWGQGGAANGGGQY